MRGKMHGFKKVLRDRLRIGDASCASDAYQTAVMQASDGGDQKAARSLAKKEVARFARSLAMSRRDAAAGATGNRFKERLVPCPSP
jgi:hypothetical protein